MKASWQRAFVKNEQKILWICYFVNFLKEMKKWKITTKCSNIIIYAFLFLILRMALYIRSSFDYSCTYGNPVSCKEKFSTYVIDLVRLNMCFSLSVLWNSRRCSPTYAHIHALACICTHSHIYPRSHMYTNHVRTPLAERTHTGRHNYTNTDIQTTRNYTYTGIHKRTCTNPIYANIYTHTHTWTHITRLHNVWSAYTHPHTHT